ncbi:amidohydrolase family protein [Chachezhania antarctica]|uniref:amidohydrolase family protein n=1 Tax=Chachezhania antarctica TaxID=2340860 RepID=UPI000EB39FBC|nr:amidohydrolase family protein [Chachezhania antarctica]|tara:strand:+ start:301 stop:1518 length:1218 start_codon:yes stop_codon:yes gene_type:complete
MTLDLVIRNALLADGAAPVDLGIRGGRIADIAPSIASDARIIDADGGRLIRGFADSHLHLDKACLLDRATNPSGTLKGAIDAVSRAKQDFTAEDIYARGARVLEKAICQGTTLIRTHVEIDPVVGLAGFEAVRRLKADYARALELQICVFPQEGLLNNPGTDDLLCAALDAGADLLGGCPYTDSDPNGQIARLFDMARHYDVDLDFHLDFDLDTSWRHLDEVARQTIAHAMQGRVAIGHVTKLSMLPPPQLEETIALMRDAGIALTVLPATDLFMMGRDRTEAVPRGVAPAHRFHAAGLCCTVATNNVLNPFTPYGDCSLPRMANLFANVAQIGDPAGLSDVFDMISAAPYRLLGREAGIRTGDAADLVLLPCPSGAAAVAEICRPVWGMKAGRMTFEAPPPRLL